MIRISAKTSNGSGKVNKHDGAAKVTENESIEDEVTMHNMVKFMGIQMRKMQGNYI